MTGRVLRQEELDRYKALMEIEFSKHAIRPGDPRYKHDVQVQDCGCCAESRVTLVTLQSQSSESRYASCFRVICSTRNQLWSLRVMPGAGFQRRSNHECKGELVR